ncbi:MAG TPA: FCD domain-containing protein [Caulobacteraceae bacterium]|nr:FCD domain-containing protein [Caulobacteraceae bacterium]
MSQLTTKSLVRVPKTAEIVAGKIRRAIVDGSIQSGESLPSEAKLIELFEVSRPTIREAIRILEFENLISVSRGARGGARVQPPTLDFVSRAMGVALQSRGATLGDIYAARSMIEPLAAKMAAETRPKEAAAALREHIERERQALETTAVIAAHTAEFHRIVMEQCGNQTFALVGLALHDLVAKHQTLWHRARPEEAAEITRKRSRAGVRSHEKLADFIDEGRGEEAESHWRLHMAKAGEFFLEVAETSVVDILEAETWT